MDEHYFSADPAVAFKRGTVLIKVRSLPSAMPYGFLARVFDVLARHVNEAPEPVSRRHICFFAARTRHGALQRR